MTNSKKFREIIGIFLKSFIVISLIIQVLSPATNLFQKISTSIFFAWFLYQIKGE